MKYYILLDENNIIRDAVTYPVDGYIEVEYDKPVLPAGINGGWWKYENGQFVEYPELKPKNPLEEEIEQLKQIIADLTEYVLFGGVEQ